MRLAVRYILIMDIKNMNRLFLKFKELMKKFWNKRPFHKRGEKVPKNEKERKVKELQDEIDLKYKEIEENTKLMGIPKIIINGPNPTNFFGVNATDYETWKNRKYNANDGISIDDAMR